MSFGIGVVTLVFMRDFVTALIDFAAASVAFGLMYYAMRTQKYQRCYYITVFAIFLGLFPYLFFAMGGYKGGVPAFFIFAVVFTAFMLEKRAAYITLAFEFAVYLGCFAAAFFYPRAVTFFESESGYFMSNVIDLAAVMAALAVIALAHFRIYNRQQRELQEASEAKSRFLANMSHEIRTPINVMTGMNEVILRESDSERIREYSRTAGRAGQSLMLLINNILDMSAIEKGKLEIAEAPYRSSDLIAALTAVGREFSKKSGLTFNAYVSEDVPAMLYGDEPHIRQIVSNFLSNAAKYTERGGFDLSFTIKPLENADSVFLQIAVADTGAGIKPETIPQLFEAFTRGDAERNRAIEGSGLGLAIAKELADKMGGSISVESEPGRGSVFTFKAAQKTVEGTSASQSEEKGIYSASFTAPDCRLLIVDDNRENTLVIQSLLNQTLLSIDTAAGGTECIDAVRKYRYDAILLDYMMPGMDGIETLTHLKTLPGFDVPVIALTANVAAGGREKLLEAGFHAYLSKPVMWRDLEQTLIDALPAERVTLNNAEAAQIPDSVIGKLAQKLEPYGITPGDGLRYTSGNAQRFAESAAFFSEAYESEIAAIQTLSGQGDWTGMKYKVHSLKSNARNLGANALSKTAEKIEALCVSGDAAYITVILQTLFYEWKRARDGADALRGMLNDGGS